MQTEEEDPSKLQKRLNQLYKERKNLINDIKAALNKKRLITDSMKEHTMVPEIHHLPKIESNAQLKSQESISEPHHHHLNTEQEQIKKVVTAQNNIKQRNKRMFGGLNSHLKKAERNIKKDE